MKLTIFGATGNLGLQLVTKALEEGHEVTAVVRNPAKLTLRSPLLHIVQADVTDPDAILPTLDHADVVISAIGPNGNEVTTICQDSAKSIVTAMEKAGVRRLLWTSGSMIADDGDNFFMRNIAKPMVRKLMSNVADGMTKAEAVIHNSRLDWTVVRPPRLTDKPAGKIRSSLEGNVGMKMARTDVATYELGILADQTTIRRNVFIAN